VLIAGGCVSETPGAPCAATAATWVYDVVSDAYAATAPLAQPRRLHGAAVAGEDDDTVYVAGGFGADGAFVVTVEAYRSGAWTELLLEIDVHAPTVCVTFDGLVFVFDGDGRGDAFDPAQNDETSAFSEEVALPEVRRTGGFGMAVVPNTTTRVAAVAVGGCAVETEVLVESAASDEGGPETATWSTAPGTAAYPFAASGLAVVAAAGHVYAVGGRACAQSSSETTPSSAVYRLRTPLDDGWESVFDVPEPLAASAAVAPWAEVVQDDDSSYEGAILYVFGGEAVADRPTNASYRLVTSVVQGGSSSSDDNVTKFYLTNILPLGIGILVLCGVLYAVWRCRERDDAETPAPGTDAAEGSGMLVLGGLQASSGDDSRAARDAGDIVGVDDPSSSKDGVEMVDIDLSDDGEAAKRGDIV